MDDDKIVLRFEEFDDMFNHFMISEENMRQIWNGLVIGNSSVILIDKYDISEIINKMARFLGY